MQITTNRMSFYDQLFVFFYLNIAVVLSIQKIGFNQEKEWKSIF